MRATVKIMLVTEKTNGIWYVNAYLPNDERPLRPIGNGYSVFRFRAISKAIRAMEKAYDSGDAWRNRV